MIVPLLFFLSLDPAVGHIGAIFQIYPESTLFYNFIMTTLVKDILELFVLQVICIQYPLFLEFAFSRTL